MKKKRTAVLTTLVVTTGIIIATLVAVYFGSCNTATKKTYEFADFEAKIQQYGKDLINEIFFVDESFKDLEFNTEGYVIEINQDGNLIGGVNLEGMPELFEELDFEPPKLLTNSNVKPKLERAFSTAKDIVIQYVSQSSIIKEEDKEEVKNAISNMKLVAGKFSQEHEHLGMATYKDIIYINDNIECELDEYVFIHELIHVINMVTAEGSKYENTYLNHGGLSEGITDILAITMLNWCEMETEAVQNSQYIKYFDTAYVLMNNDEFNLLEAYYYPDNYDKLIEMTSEDFVKCIFASVFALDSQGYALSNYLTCNYYLIH